MQIQKLVSAYHPNIWRCGVWMFHWLKWCWKDWRKRKPTNYYYGRNRLKWSNNLPLRNVRHTISYIFLLYGLQHLKMGLLVLCSYLSLYLTNVYRNYLTNSISKHNCTMADLLVTCAQLYQKLPKRRFQGKQTTFRTRNYQEFKGNIVICAPVT